MSDEESIGLSLLLAPLFACLFCHHFGSVPLRTCRGSMSGAEITIGDWKRTLDFHMFYFHQPEFALARTISDALFRMTFESRKVVPSAVNGDLVCMHEGISFALIPPPVVARYSLQIRLGNPPVLRHPRDTPTSSNRGLVGAAQLPLCDSSPSFSASSSTPRSHCRVIQLLEWAKSKPETRSTHPCPPSRDPALLSTAPVNAGGRQHR
ncbi:hypothetical protein ARMGADRAFT_683460 [Armillaria gallica]|uniref:Uncharacterized protein n=1 Tax=Armillaria gallica TaxID=47427 RepID=A0A2H3CX35_ARMGA|nr:hypothetical protein ARMGADRAFT_683460 [Armillaria gallica]